jgi:hypothetical protein
MSVRKRHPVWQLLLIAGAALAVPSTAAAAAHSTRTVLGGFTSQGSPVVVVISPDRRRVVRVGIALDMRCTSGARFTQQDGGGPFPIGAGGRVRTAVNVAPAAGPSVSLVGGSDLFAGTLRRSGAAFAGIWRLQLVFRTADGHTDTCNSGRVTFSATA